ncbi:MAG: hypothetical protein GC136_08605 [Alphaproteobacteria bacterium]|nr:hypothetical protein [Alphaproteobacteria bacterium]
MRFSHCLVSIFASCAALLVANEAIRALNAQEAPTTYDHAITLDAEGLDGRNITVLYSVDDTGAIESTRIAGRHQKVAVSPENSQDFYSFLNAQLEADIPAGTRIANLRRLEARIDGAERVFAEDRDYLRFYMDARQSAYIAEDLAEHPDWSYIAPHPMPW